MNHEDFKTEQAKLEKNVDEFTQQYRENQKMIARLKREAEEIEHLIRVSSEMLLKYREDYLQEIERN